jgi:rubredoxin
MLENIDEELVRCRPCGYVMKKSELGTGVCPACGLPHTVFEPYREKVSAKRLFLLGLDIHPIAIHLSQTFVAMIPGLMIFHLIFPNFFPEIIHPVISFSVFVFPLTLLLSFASGLLDGMTRFKTLETPLLKSKIIYSLIIVVLAGLVAILFKPETYNFWIVLLSLGALVCAVKLGLLGKKLINVILPGTYQRRKKKVTGKTAAKVAPKPKVEESPTAAE